MCVYVWFVGERVWWWCGGCSWSVLVVGVFQIRARVKMKGPVRSKKPFRKEIRKCGIRT